LAETEFWIRQHGQGLFENKEENCQYEQDGTYAAQTDEHFQRPFNENGPIRTFGPSHQKGLLDRLGWKRDLHFP